MVLKQSIVLFRIHSGCELKELQRLAEDLVLVKRKLALKPVSQDFMAVFLIGANIGVTNEEVKHDQAAVGLPKTRLQASLDLIHGLKLEAINRLGLVRDGGEVVRNLDIIGEPDSRFKVTLLALSSSIFKIVERNESSGLEGTDKLILVAHGKALFIQGQSGLFLSLATKGDEGVHVIIRMHGTGNKLVKFMGIGDIGRAL